VVTVFGGGVVSCVWVGYVVTVVGAGVEGCVGVGVWKDPSVRSDVVAYAVRTVLVTGVGDTVEEAIGLDGIVTVGGNG
jgi:hypothetical protein